MGNHPTREQVVSFYQEALRTATTWPNFLAKLALMAASFDGPHSWSYPKQVWTRRYDSNIHYAYIFMLISQNQNLILDWHREQGLSDSYRTNSTRYEIMSRDNREATLHLHEISIKDMYDHKLNFDEDTFVKLRSMIDKAHRNLPKRVEITVYNGQQMIDVYRQAQAQSSDLYSFLANLIEHFTINIDGLRRARYIGMSYHQTYLMYLDMLSNIGVESIHVPITLRQDFIEWHRKELIFSEDIVEQLISIVNMVP